MLNATFSTMVDAYIDRFILAALHGFNASMKIKLFEKYDSGAQAGKPNPLFFTLIGLLSGKELIGKKSEDFGAKSIDLSQTVNDMEKAQILCARIDFDIENCFMSFAKQAHSNFRVQQNVIQTKRA